MIVEDVKLKPCPFCGGEAEVAKEKYEQKWIAYVRCKNCNVQTERLWESIYYCAISESETRWNNRIDAVVD